MEVRFKLSESCNLPAEAASLQVLGLIGGLSLSSEVSTL
jgi:hypothetical protein